jgi:uncharacterized protein YcaQ
MSLSPLVVSVAQARRFVLRAAGLAEPHGSVAAGLAHHGYVQIDPINVCGRMHDLILRTRVAGYREGDLMRFLHGEMDAVGGGTLAAERRTAFEHHLPSTHILVALEAEAWPHLRRAMRERSRRAGAWSGRLTAREVELAKRIFAALEERGPLGPEAMDDPRRSSRGWGSATLAKATMQKLFFHGRLLIGRRDAAGRRLYDLPERVLPAEVLARREATAEETARWEALLKLRQRRLCALKRAELAVVSDAVRAVRIEGAAGLVYCLREDEGALAAAADEAHGMAGGRLLAPLDPLIYDRALTRVLWDFEYTWEVYTPAARRARGYYALPLLAGGELVGHVDPKADRAARRLVVIGREARRGHSAAAGVATAELAGFLGLRVARAVRASKASS